MSTDDDLALPNGAAEPGTYDCTWSLNGVEVPGAVELLGGKFPHGTARCDLVSPTVTPENPNATSRAYPQRENRDHVVGYIESLGRRIVLVGVSLTTVVPNTTWLDADLALVGRGISVDAPPAFDNCRFQVTGLELFAGFAPLTYSQVPRKLDGEHEWKTKGDEVSKEWERDGTTLSLEFSASAKAHDPYRFDVRFAPWAAITTTTPVPAEQWYRKWMAAMLTLVSAATGRVESGTHMTMKSVDGTKVTVFTAGLDQAPYYARRDRPMYIAYTATSGDHTPLDVLRRLFELQDAEHPFVIDYDPAILARDQHPRSRVLQEVQWIEAAYEFENRAEWETRRSAHTEKRQQVLTLLDALRKEERITGKLREFIKKCIGTEPRRNLDPALKVTFDRHEQLHVRDRLRALAIVEVERQQDGCDTVEDAVRSIRNGLSHGRAVFGLRELDDLAEMLRQFVRAEFLRLVGCDYEPRAMFDSPALPPPSSAEANDMTRP